MKKTFKNYVNISFILLLIVFINEKSASKDFIKDTLTCNNIEIQYERYIVRPHYEKKEREVINVNEINYWENIEKSGNDKLFNQSKFYIFFVNDFINDSLVLLRGNFINGEFKNNIDTLYRKFQRQKRNTYFADSIEISHVTDVTDVNPNAYYRSKFELKINNERYLFNADPDLIFILIYYNKETKLVKIINSNKIPEFIK